jgi:hypothetical protein
MADALENASCIIETVDREGLTDEHWDYTDGEVIVHIRNVVFIILFLLAVPLNFYVIGKIFWKKVYSEPTYMLLLSLCISDLLICFIYFPFSVATGFSGHYSFGNTDFERCQVCKVGTVFPVCNLVSAFNVMLLSVDRCVYFVKPLRYHIYVTPLRTGIAIFLAWAVAILVYVPALAGYGDIILTTACGGIFGTEAHVRRSFSIFGASVVVFSVIAIVLAVTNILTVREVCKQQKKTRAATNAAVAMMEMTEMGAEEAAAARQLKEELRKKEVKRQLKLLKVFGGILFVNFMSLVPAIALSVAIPFAQVPVWYLFFVLFCMVSQVVFHPLVEAFFAPELQVKIWKTCKTWCTCGRCSCCKKNTQ